MESTTTLFVSGFYSGVSEEEIRKHLQQFATVINFRLVTDKKRLKSRGYGFLEIQSSDLNTFFSSNITLGGSLLRFFLANNHFNNEEVGVNLIEKAEPKYFFLCHKEISEALVFKMLAESGIIGVKSLYVHKTWNGESKGYGTFRAKKLPLSIWTELCSEGSIWIGGNQSILICKSKQYALKLQQKIRVTDHSQFGDSLSLSIANITQQSRSKLSDCTKNSNFNGIMREFHTQFSTSFVNPSLDSQRFIIIGEDSHLIEVTILLSDFPTFSSLLSFADRPTIHSTTLQTPKRYSHDELSSSGSPLVSKVVQAGYRREERVSCCNYIARLCVIKKKAEI